jgi:FAD/FMN-containing dehydrogenase
MIEIKDHSGLSGKVSDFFSPINDDELINFLKKHPDSKFRIGGGLSGVSGAAVPFDNEIFIDFSNFKSLSWVDKKAGIFTASAGNTMFEIKNFVEAEGWNFPILPGSLHKATIGGMIACNGGGPFSLRYGKIGNFVKALDVVTCSGQLMQFGSQCNKISEGPDFSKLFIGSEGSLGFLTKATLQCIRMPEIELYRISHHSFEELVAAVSDFLQYNPLYLEMAEPDALRFSSGATKSVMWLGLQRGTTFVQDKHSKFIVEKLNPDKINERFDIGVNLQSYKKFTDLDISFPISRGSELLSELKKFLNSHKLESAFFGHAGDGNWHIHVFYDDKNPFDGALSATFDSILFKHEGHISGEHGIGRIHKERFVKYKNADYKMLYLSIKSHLDPKNQLPSIF